MRFYHNNTGSTPTQRSSKVLINLTSILFCCLILPAFPLNASAKQKQQDPSIVVTVLGSGTPVPSATQFGPAVLVQAGGRDYIFDCGRACASRLAQVDTSLLKRVERLFITHMHSDHILGIPDLWLSGWLQERQQPLSIWGPIGTAAMMANLRKAFSVDIDLRIADKIPAPGPGLDDDIVEIGPTGGILLEENGVTITAFQVDHGHVKPAYGYKIEYQGHSVVISGDTTETESLHRYSKGVDLVLLEVMSPALITYLGDNYTVEQVDKIRSYHLTVAQAGNIFSKSKPRMAAYYHTRNDGVFLESLISQTKVLYKGPLEVSHDLIQFRIGKEIEVNDLRIEGQL